VNDRGVAVSVLRFKNAAVNVFRDMEKNHTMAFSAALSYYFVVALFPFLIFLSAVAADLRLPDFFGQVMGLAARVIPASSRGPLRDLTDNTIFSRHSHLLTFGILFTLWSASRGFTALIDALNTAYDVRETRRYWKTQGLAIGLTFSAGILVVIALGLLLVGSDISLWLATTARVSGLWPYLRWSGAIVCTVLAVELLYFIAPNMKHSFWSTLPGALLAVGCWIGLSYLLGVYFQEFAKYSKGYGSLGVALAFSIWLYWASFVILIGAQFNSRLLRGTKEVVPAPGVELPVAIDSAA
jgi:membrane protein